ncbi:MAG: glycosyl hydrolase [Saprospiraceae bacterium]|nr:glycosyl hydrolase [Saprospiraceae bacterium]
MTFRELGPYRGGRSCTVTGVPGESNLFYFGSTGGGIWKTGDGGRTWKNISDGFFGGSIGAIAVSPSDKNVIYAGGGEITVRGNVSSGEGIWRSEDAGKTWIRAGLPLSRHIARIRIDPRDPYMVYAAVLGDLYEPTEERGVYKSTDGGNSWKRVLFVHDKAGAVDLILDPTNPRILYATTWKVSRTPYSLSSGGDGSGIWKSTNSGETWKEITRNKGLPTDTIGIVGITVSPVHPERVWAIIESQTGGVFRSDDGGETWQKMNDDRSLRQRAWYYSRIYADPQDVDRVYIMNVAYHVSSDGGRTFTSQYAPHGDHHDLWIAPEDPSRMIIADDGGAQVTYDAGQTWTTYHNQPTAQFYRVTTDQHFPFRILAAQQDNSAIRILHRSPHAAITDEDWESTAGCECGFLAPSPLDPEIVYGGCYGGLIQRLDHRTGYARNISVWPDNPMGHGVEGMRYRFQWNFPILFSPHDPHTLYTCSHVVHRSQDEGQSWEVISPDLTRNDSTRMGPSGGPITKDNTSVEYYCTIFAMAESPISKGVIWTGSDDGLVHVTRDGGTTWKNVTPPKLPKWAQINCIEASSINAGTACIAATRYKSGDPAPYLFRTTDFGVNWRRIDSGIDREHFTRTIRDIPDHPGWLVAGTERGLYVSDNDGAQWYTFQRNLPIVPITDMTLRDGYLIIATQGRGIWIMDDLTPLLSWKEAEKDTKPHLFPPRDIWRIPGHQSKEPQGAGTNHQNGLSAYFTLPQWKKTDSLWLRILDANGNRIREWGNHASEKANRLEVKEGANTFHWNLSYPKAKDFDGMILWWATLDGPQALPGEYSLEMVRGTDTLRQPFRILADPRIEFTVQDQKEQFRFLDELNQTVTKAHQTIEEIRIIRKQVDGFTALIPPDSTYSEVKKACADLDSVMTDIETELYQTKNRSNQDPLNFPIQLTNKLAHLNNVVREGPYPPTQQAWQVKAELEAAIQSRIKKWEEVKSSVLPAFNQSIRNHALDVIRLPKKED